MGGGRCVQAIRQHLAAGLSVYATPAAAKTVYDDLARVEKMGVRLTDAAPDDRTVSVRLQDINLNQLSKALNIFMIDLPEIIAIAVQDHGDSTAISNREFRFQHWRRFIDAGGDIRCLLYREAPRYLTRMRAIQRDVPGTLVMDTVAAAFWGALEDFHVAKHHAQGLVVVNIGNQHTTGALLKEWRIYGLFEHHTGLITTAKLTRLIDGLRTRTLTHQNVFQDGGHGCYFHPDFRPDRNFDFTSVTGPRRELAAGLGYMATPHGNMMLAGCYGLIAAMKLHDH
jgi:uncharacterized protein (DUF1786 family)